jgi:formate hydrogenlyase transcriptional activator
MHRQIVDIDEPTMELARCYSWPGNVRELENLVERAMIVANGDLLHLDPAWLQGESGQNSSRETTLANLERHSILETLQRCHGKIYGPDGAAAALGLKPTTLYGKMRKHRIRRLPGTVAHA